MGLDAQAPLCPALVIDCAAMQLSAAGLVASVLAALVMVAGLASGTFCREVLSSAPTLGFGRKQLAAAMGLRFAASLASSSVAAPPTCSPVAAPISSAGDSGGDGGPKPHGDGGTIFPVASKLNKFGCVP